MKEIKYKLVLNMLLSYIAGRLHHLKRIDIDMMETEDLMVYDTLMDIKEFIEHLVDTYGE